MLFEVFVKEWGNLRQNPRTVLFRSSVCLPVPFAQGLSTSVVCSLHGCNFLGRSLPDCEMLSQQVALIATPCGPCPLQWSGIPNVSTTLKTGDD